MQYKGELSQEYPNVYDVRKLSINRNMFAASPCVYTCIGQPLYLRNPMQDIHVHV